MNSLDTDYLWGTAATVAGTTMALTFDANIRQGQSIFVNLTVAKVQRAALYAMACLAPVVTAIVTRAKENAFLSLIGSAFCIFAASRIRDYDDAKELQIMKAAAANMNFHQLAETHGLETIVKYQIVQDLPARFSVAYSGVPFSSIIRDYSLERIAHFKLCPLTLDSFLHDKFVHELAARKWDFLRVSNLGNPLYTHIMSAEMYTGLIQLTNALHDIDKIYNRTLDDLNIAYSERTDRMLAKFAERERNIPALARRLGEQVASQATGNAMGNAVVNSVWDGDTKHIVRDATTGYSVAEAAGKYAERAELERLYAELQRDRSNPVMIARGAKEQNAYDMGVFEARQERDANILKLENILSEIISRN